MLAQYGQCNTLMICTKDASSFPDLPDHTNKEYIKTFFSRNSDCSKPLNIRLLQLFPKCQHKHNRAIFPTFLCFAYRKHSLLNKINVEYIVIYQTVHIFYSPSMHLSWSTKSSRIEVQSSLQIEIHYIGSKQAELQVLDCSGSIITHSYSS